MTAPYPHRCIINLVCALAVGGCATIPRDEPLDPGAAAFYAQPADAIDPNNASVGLMGLSAPAGQDFMAYGRALAAQPAARNLYEAQKRSEVPDALTVRWNQERMNCWTDDYEPFDQDPRCAPIEEAIQTLQDNAELLRRYRLVLKMPAAPGFIQAGGVRSIEMAKLTAIAVKTDLRQQRYGEAYRTWADQYAFWRKMNSVGRTWVEVAIGLVNEGLALGNIESLLFRYPQLIDKHHDELNSLLSPEGVSRFNFPGIMLAEHAILMQAYQADGNKDAILPNYMTNRHYRYAQQMLEVARLPASELNDIGSNRCKCLQRVELSADDPRFTFSAEFVRPSVYLGTFELIKSMHDKNRRMALLSMRIKLYKDKVPDAKIAAYLIVNSGNLHEPSTNGPMKWDQVRRVLYFNNPNNRGSTEVRL